MRTIPGWAVVWVAESRGLSSVGSQRTRRHLGSSRPSIIRLLSLGHMDSDDGADFAALAALAAGPCVALVGPSAAPSGDDDLEDLQGLVAVAAAVVPRGRFEHRSWAHARNARAGKALKRALREASDATAAEANARNSWLIDVAHGGHGAVASRRLDPATRALLKVAMACRRTIRGNSTAIVAQARAAATVAAFVLAAQRSEVDACFSESGRSPEGRGSTDARLACAKGSSQRVHTFSWQWDETTQRMRVPNRPGGKRRRFSSACTSMQVMMQHASAHTALVQSGRVVENSMPYFMRALVLEQTKADHLLEGLMRSCPLPLDDPLAMAPYASSCDWFLLTLTTDRASVNYSVCLWFFSCLARLPRHVVGHMEPCSAHSIHLVKGRNSVGKEVASALNTFSNLLRQFRFNDALQAVIRDRICASLQVRCAQRPKFLAVRGESLLRALFGDASSPQHRRAPRGEKRTSEFYQAAEAFVKHVDIDLGATPALVHWCWVEEGSAEESLGLQVGTPCCRSREEAVERVTFAVTNYMFGKAWDQAAVSRWLHVGKLLTRAMLLCVGSNGILPQALVDLKLSWDLPDTVEAHLQRLIKEDTSNFEAKRKLKLMKTCRVFGRANIGTDMAVMWIMGAVVDSFLYAVLGHERERATLLNICDPVDSPLLKSMHQLCQLLEVWSPEAEGWFLTTLVATDFDSREVRLAARRQGLHLSCGLFELFELRLSRPPYSLLRLCCPGVSADDRDAAATSFLAENIECLPLLCSRLRAQCPSKAALLENAPALLRSLGMCTMTAIDFTERSHAQVRVDIASAGAGKSATACANRVLCRQVLAAHQHKGGADVSNRDVVFGKRCLAGPDVRCQSSGEAGPSRHPGNPQIRFQNWKMKAAKQLRAPDRPLTDQEMEHIRSRSSSEWEKIRSDPEQLDMWSRFNRAECIVARLPGLDDGEADAGTFKGLWGLSSDERHLVAPSALVAAGVHTSVPSKDIVWDDPSIWVRDDAPDRSSQAADVSPSVLYGCYGKKRNICREHSLDPRTVRSLDRLVARLSAWTDALGKEGAAQSNNLLWLHGAREEDGAIDGGASLDRSHSEPSDAIVLLVSGRYSPKLQYFAPCHIYGRRSSALFFAMPPYPFLVSLDIGPSRMGGSAKVIQYQTSDELAMTLLQCPGVTHWQFFPLTWELPMELPSLVHMRVIRNEVEFDQKSRARNHQKSFRETGLPREFDLGDPFTHGAQSVEQNNADAADAEPSDSAAMYDGVAEVAEDDCTSSSSEATEVMVAEDIDNMDDAGDDEGGDDDDEEDIFGDDAAEPTAAELAAAAEVQATGHVRSRMHPWNKLAAVGRITTWPENKPMDSRSVSCRCYAHPRCSIAKPRKRVTDAVLLTWLFSGRIPSIESTAAEKAAMQREHLAKFDEVLAAAAAASSSTSGP